MLEELLLCPVAGCGVSLHQQCEQSLADLGVRQCPGCGDEEQFSEEMNFFGVWFRNKKQEQQFVSQTSSEPSSIITNYLKTQSRSIISLLSSQSSSSLGIASVTPSISSDTSTDHRSMEIGDISSMIGSCEGKSDFYDYLFLNLKYFLPDSSRDSSPAYRRKMTKLPGRSPKKRVAKMITNELLKSSSSHRRQVIIESEVSESGAETVEPAVKKVAVTYTDDSDVPLSDIDDILSGNISDVENHPMKQAIFSQDNKHLGEVLSKVHDQHDDIGEKMNENSEHVQRINDDALEVTKKRGRPKMKKKDSPRKLLMKNTVKKFSESSKPSVKEPSQKKVTATKRLRFLPLSARPIVHGRNWTLVTGAHEEESECYHDWINQFSSIKLSEIADINKSEKLLMSMWNTHLNEYCGGQGAKHMDTMMINFVKKHADTILRKKLYRNFLSHASSFSQTGALKPETLHACLLLLQEKVSFSELDQEFNFSRTNSSISATVTSSPTSPSPSSSSVSSNNNERSEDLTLPLPAVSPHTRGMKMLNLARNNSHKHDLTFSPGQESKRLKMSSPTSSSRQSTITNYFRKSSN